MNETERLQTGRDSRQGTTFIEVVIALMIFGVCVAGLSALALSIHQGSDIARDHYVAVNIAKNRIERAKTTEFSQLFTLRESGTLVDVNGNVTTSGNYRRVTTITAVNSVLQEITVSVWIRNRVSLKFEPAVEGVRSYITEIRGPPTT